MAFSPVWEVSPEGLGQTLASTSEDGTVKLWARNGRLINTLEGHSPIMSVAFSPDGQTLASTNFDNTVNLWERHL